MPGFILDALGRSPKKHHPHLPQGNFCLTKQHGTHKKNLMEDAWGNKPHEADAGLSELGKVIQSRTVLSAGRGLNSCPGRALVLKQNVFHCNQTLSSCIHPWSNLVFPCCSAEGDFLCLLTETGLRVTPDWVLSSGSFQSVWCGLGKGEERQNKSTYAWTYRKMNMCASIMH